MFDVLTCRARSAAEGYEAGTDPKVRFISYVPKNGYSEYGAHGSGAGRAVGGRVWWGVCWRRGDGGQEATGRHMLGERVRPLPQTPGLRILSDYQLGKLRYRGPAMKQTWESKIWIQPAVLTPPSPCAPGPAPLYPRAQLSPRAQARSSPTPPCTLPGQGWGPVATNAHSLAGVALW